MAFCMCGEGDRGSAAADGGLMGVTAECDETRPRAVTCNTSAGYIHGIRLLLKSFESCYACGTYCSGQSIMPFI